MRDGARLATDVYLPVRDGPAETLLVRLCYDKNGRSSFMGQMAPRVTARGYAFVVQDVRGKFRSEGEGVAFVHESEDGFDTLEWLTQQPFCNGTVGMLGDSYYGFTQWAAVSSGHPALKAIAPRVTSVELATPHARPSGPSGTVQDPTWLVLADYFAHYWLDELTHEFPLDYGRRPVRAVFEDAFRALGKRSVSFDRFLSGGPFESFPGRHPFDAEPLPVLHSVGWFDNLLIRHLRDYLELLGRPGWAPLQYLIADSVDHDDFHLSLAPCTEETDHLLNDAALGRLLPRHLDPVLDFFDVFLKRTRDVASLPRVRWHLGHDGYHEAESWPPPGALPRRYYLGVLAEAAEGAGGELSDEPPAVTESVSWYHDARNLVPSVVADSFNFLRDYPDESATGNRSDVLVFSGQPARTPLDLAGPIELVVRMRSSAPGTELYAKLLDLAPDGSARMIARGQGHLVAPSTDAAARIEMGHTGYRLRPGHALRLHVASSDYPEYLPHPGTAEDPWEAAGDSGSSQTLVTGPADPAYLSVTEWR